MFSIKTKKLKSQAGHSESTAGRMSVTITQYFTIVIRQWKLLKYDLISFFHFLATGRQSSNILITFLCM